MQYRKFGQTDWEVSDIGYGMWGMGGWTGSDDEESLAALQRSVDLGCNFFDTALVYGDGRSEKLLGQIIRANPDKKLFNATKVPPKNMEWPTLLEHKLEDCYPPDHIERSLHQSLENAGVESFDLLQLHTWNDAWAEETGWSDKMEDLKRQGLIKATGISINRWEPWNGVKAVWTGKIDAVQVIYNIFDQNPEDNLFPACREMDVAVIARVPFDEGTLTGKITKDTRFPEDDWRSRYFSQENLVSSVERADELKPLVPEGSTLAEMALRFILSNPDVSTIIPGMRKIVNVEANIASSDAGPLPENLVDELRKHRWVRKPAPWSD